jgi:hypothetical protein
MAGGGFMSSAESRLSPGGGAVTVTHPAPDVILFEVVGVLDSRCVDEIVAATDQAIQSAGAIHVFHDWSEMTNYESHTRKRLTDYVEAVKSKLLSSHILFRSRIVAMGVSVANLVLNQRLSTYTDKEKFTASMVRIVNRK